MKEEREELTRLRKENRELRIERDLLKKSRPSSPGTSSLRDGLAAVKLGDKWGYISR